MPVTNATRRFRERRDIEKRISRPVDAIAVAGDITSLAVKLGELEMRRADIDADLRSASRASVTNHGVIPGNSGIGNVLRRVVTDWDGHPITRLAE
jgi:hypothetical protein